MGVNSLPKTVPRQRRDCDLNPDPCAPESSMLTYRATRGGSRLKYLGSWPLPFLPFLSLPNQQRQSTEGKSTEVGPLGTREFGGVL